MLLVKSGEIGSRKNEEAESKPTMPNCGWASLVAQSVKNLPAVQESRVQSLEKENPQRRKWQTIAVSLPGKHHGQRSLAGCSPQGCKESGATERLTQWW